jgi:hypothetical protein
MSRGMREVGLTGDVHGRSTDARAHEPRRCRRPGLPIPRVDHAVSTGRVSTPYALTLGPTDSASPCVGTRIFCFASARGRVRFFLAILRLFMQNTRFSRHLPDFRGKCLAKLFSNGRVPTLHQNTSPRAFKRARASYRQRARCPPPCPRHNPWTMYPTSSTSTP